MTTEQIILSNSASGLVATNRTSPSRFTVLNRENKNDRYPFHFIGLKRVTLLHKLGQLRKSMPWLN